MRAVGPLLKFFAYSHTFCMKRHTSFKTIAWAATGLAFAAWAEVKTNIGQMLLTDPVNVAKSNADFDSIRQ